MARVRSALRLRRALVGMEAAHAVVAALANAVEAKDASTERHCERLAVLATRLGVRVGLGPTELDAVTYGALLHDVGKIGVPDAVLTKAGPLTDEEWVLIRRHPEIGERICAPLEAFAAFGPSDAWAGPLSASLPASRPIEGRHRRVARLSPLYGSWLCTNRHAVRRLPVAPRLFGSPRAVGGQLLPSTVQPGTIHRPRAAGDIGAT